MGFSRPLLPGEPARLRLRVSSNGRYLVHGHSTPFQIRGASPWVLVQLSQADVVEVLDNVAAKGFNSIIMMSAVSPAAEAQYGPPNFYSETPFTDADFTLNADFWAHVDYILAQAAARGIVVQLAFLYTGHASAGDGWGNYVAAASEAECFAFGATLGTRYANTPNLIWVAGGDDIPNSNKAKWDAIADGILSTDSSHLMTAHTARGETARDYGSYITLNATYRNDVSVASGTLSDYAGSPTLPTYLLEAYYEGSYSGQPTLSATDVRCQAWQALLSGACGANYGHHTVWPFDSGWESALNAAGAQYMAVMHTLFQEQQWWKLVPDSSSTLVTSGRGSSTSYVAASLASDATFAMIYLPAGAGSIQVDLTQMAGSSNVRPTWIDPTTGTKYPVTPVAQASGVTFNKATARGNNAAGAADWYLLLEVV